MDLSHLETPCLVLDQTKLKRNIRSMRERIARLGVQFRPHVKTPKCIEIMRIVLTDQVKTITVSTIKEAEYFFSQGATSMLYAVGIAPVKLDHIAGLRKRGADIAIILDSPELVEIAAQTGRRLGVDFPVLIEIDSDDQRAGVKPDDPLLIHIGRKLHQEKGVALMGVMTHAGGSYHSKTIEDIRQFARRERADAVRSSENLRRAGLPCPVVSVGSTPTATFGEDFSGVTEVRAGVFMFQDLVMAGLGVCQVDDIAVSVLASVIGHQKQKGWVLTDAGWMALSRDRGTAEQALDQGYGLVCDLNGKAYPDLIISAASQEHGIMTGRQGHPLKPEDFPIGSMVRVLPNHACAMAAMHDRYYVVDGSTEVRDTWQRINGW